MFLVGIMDFSQKKKISSIALKKNGTLNGTSNLEPRPRTINDNDNLTPYGHSHRYRTISISSHQTHFEYETKKMSQLSDYSKFDHLDEEDSDDDEQQQQQSAPVTNNQSISLQVKQQCHKVLHHRHTISVSRSWVQA